MDLDPELRLAFEEYQKELPAEQARSRLLGLVFGKCASGAPHEWFVFSRAIAGACLMVECRTCQAYGVVRNVSEEEWCEFAGVTWDPHPWELPERVEILSGGAVEPGKSMSMGVQEAAKRKWRECQGEWDETKA